jgi:Leucine-rich repeat (LRR) protein
MFILYMNIIQNKRETIIRENNTAQEKLINILETHDKTITELIINESLHGELDLSIFENMGFNKIKHLDLGEGEITGIVNYPKTLQVLKCANNLLVELQDLPNDILDLDFQYNYLTHCDFKGLNKLYKINISHNRIDEIENLPPNLEELYIENNNLKNLDLLENNKLRVLHISHNPNVIIENVPKSLVDLKMEENPFSEVTYQEMHVSEKEEHPENRMNFYEAVNEFFKMKDKYETQLYEKRKIVYESKSKISKNIGKKMAQQVKPVCINCNRPVGTIFSIKKGEYSAICGDVNVQTKCNLNIKLVGGNFSNHDSVLYMFKDEIEDLKEKIIMRKLDTLFNYVDERKTIANFKKELEDYNFTSGIYKQLYDKNIELHNDPVRKELIMKKENEVFKLMEGINKLLEEYTKENNKEILRNAVEIQIKELVPEMENLRRLKNELMEMDNKVTNGGGFGKSTIDVKCTLTQRYVNLSKHDFMFGEEPMVVKFVKTGK